MGTQNRPNILILYSDQHSARTLGCYGNDQVRTPFLDRLAREGVRMNRAYTQNPICTPSRVCMLSGQYAHNTGYYGLAGEKPEKLPNLFEYFKEQGYLTGAAGKLHTPAGGYRKSVIMLLMGMDMKCRSIRGIDTWKKGVRDWY